MEQQQQHVQLILDTLRPGMRELESIWDYIGYEDDERTLHLQSLADDLQQRLAHFINNENQQRVELESKIESRKRKAAQVCQSLRLAPYFPPRGLASMQLLQNLDAHIAQFEQQITDRQSKFAQLSTDVQHLCDCLDADTAAEMADLPTAGDRPDEFIPTEQDLQRLSDKQQQLQQCKDIVLQSINAVCDDIRRIATDIEYLPENGFESAVIDSLDCSQVMKLSEQTLSQLQAWRLKLVKHKAMLVGTCDELREHVTTMWHRLGIPQQEQQQFLDKHSGYRPSTMEALQEESDKCQQLKWQQLPAYISGLRCEAEDLANRCFANEEGEEDGKGVEASEEEAARLEKRVEKLRQKYENNKELYDAVQQYQLTWAAFLDVEQRMKDPNIFSNRGGILLKTEKERKHLAKELPRVESRVAEQLQQIGAEQFRICGRTFQQHVQHLWHEFRNEKEAAKTSRKMPRSATEDGGRLGGLSSGSTNSLASPRKSVVSKR